MKTIFHIRRRRLWSAARWVAVASSLPLIWACTARTLEPTDVHPAVVWTNRVKASLNDQIDILFMIDNSQSMAPLQDKLLANFPVFMNILKGLPMGLPDIHVAVVSSDTGPGTYDLPGIHCRYLGDAGLFQTAARGACAASPLNAGQTYLQASGNQAQTNYSGDITDAFTCIAALGEGGCGFEGQLKSVRWALDTDPGDDDPAPAGTPAANQGFLRAGAYLAVILITNEDDCSVPTYSDLIDPSSTHNADRYGPLWSFRCNEFGHLCSNVAGSPPGTLAHPVRGANTDLTGCVSNDSPPLDPANPNGVETRVSDEIAFLRGLKDDPTQILVAAITGPITPYNVNLMNQTLSDGTIEMQPNTEHSCLENSGEYADPSVRIQQWVNGVASFGGQSFLLPICADSFAPALTQIAKAIGGKIGPQCVPGTVRNDAAGIPDCAINDSYRDETTNQPHATTISACAGNGNVPPCWSLDDDATKCAAGSKLLNINRGTATLANNVDTDVSCQLCPGDVTETGCP